MRTYFNNIIHGVTSAFEGMSITFSSLFFPAVTVQYPEVDVRSVESQRKTYDGPMMGMPDNYRGILHVDMEICTVCMLCVRACPIDVIAIDKVKCEKEKFAGRSGKMAVKTSAATRFDIDIGKCMFCGLCVEPCPTGAIYHTNEFEMNTSTVEELVLTFVSPEEAADAQAKAKIIEAEKAAKKAAKAAEDAKAKEAEAAAPKTETKGEE